MNLFDYEIPKRGELFTTLLAHKNIKINRIVSAAEVKSDIYLQEEDEWVLLLEGEAVLLIKEEEHTLNKGESLLIPAHTPHRVLHTTEGTLWLTVHIY